MTCHHREQEILLLAHGELAPLQSWRVRAHLRHCRCCRERYVRLSAVSSALAMTLAAPGRPPWTCIVGAKTLFGMRRLIVLLVCLLSLTALLVYRTARLSAQQNVCPPEKASSSTVGPVRCL